DSHKVTVRLSPEPEVAAATPAPVPVQATVADLLKPASDKPGPDGKSGGHHREGTDGSNPRMAGSGAGR
ncbi:MAG: inorganic phosphate transporter, partial [Propionibacterium sp.]|nr:inorganic phosphate transporter [Propionibacterium sp.]